MVDLPEPNQSRLEAIAAAADAAKPVEPAPKKAEAPGGTVKKGGRGKGITRIVEEMKRTGDYVTDDTGTVYRYDEGRGAFEPLSKQRLLALALAQDAKSGPSKRNAIVEQIQAATYVPKLTWGRVAESEIPCADGVLDVLTWELSPHKAERLLERSLPVAWKGGGECPTWMKALAIWFPEKTDAGRTGALQEFFGYICLAHARYKRAAVLYGESNTGKSVPAMVAKALVGDEYTCSISVEHMDDPVRLALIKGKALNIMTEVSAEALIADGGFKTLVSTEEPIMLDAKYKPPETYISTAKHLIVTNNLPRLNDHTSATFNRLLILPLDVIIQEGDQDRELLAKLKAELPGILRWAAEGARRLVGRQGQWPDVPASRAIMTSYRDEMNPMRQFLRERMIAADDKMVPLQLLAKRFNEWNMGARNVGIKGVGKLLRAAGLGSALKVAKYDGRAITCLLGYRLAGPINDALLVGASTGTVDEGGLEVMTARENTAAGARAMALEGDGDDTS